MCVMCFLDNRCATLRYMAHVIAADGYMNATVTNTEQMTCEEGYRFTDGTTFSDITCVSQSGVLIWDENVPDCESTCLLFALFIFFFAVTNTPTFRFSVGICGITLCFQLSPVRLYPL